MSSSAKRLEAIDVARGSAMFFVCLSHFAGEYIGLAHEGISGPIVRLALIASPTFVLMSGLTMAMLVSSRTDGAPALRAKLMDRAVFMLLVVHPLLALTQTGRYGVGGALRVVYVTDALAISILAAVPLVGVLPLARRAALGVLLLLGTWAIVLPAHLAGISEGPLALLFGELSAGPTPNRPPIPWAGVYLVGTVLGELLARRGVDGSRERISRALLRLGFYAVGVASVLKLVYWAGLLVIPHAHDAPPALYPLTSIWQKFPPGPVYVGFFGGIGLMTAGMMAAWAEARPRAAVIRWLGVVGKSSLVAFVVQSFIYHFVLRSLHLPFTPLWPFLFVATFGLVVLSAMAWQRWFGNDLLSVRRLVAMLLDATRRTVAVGLAPFVPRGQA